MIHQLVIGAGEVGRAVAQVLDCPLRDLTPAPDDPERVFMLHICFPWSETFAEQVRAYQHRYAASVIVVHSTVPVGTCRSLDACHSPVRGRHPRLVEGLRAHRKFFAGRGAQAASWAFETAGIECELVDEPETTEAGKLWDLLQYGWSVLLAKRMWGWMLERGADPHVAYRRMNEAYNEGYRRLGEEHFTRPVLDYEPGPVGGHCVVQNAALIDDEAARLLIRLNGELEAAADGEALQA